jgi:hypothetical protein
MTIRLGMFTSIFTIPVNKSGGKRVKPKESALPTRKTSRLTSKPRIPFMTDDLLH